jgi:hypothetical protein
MLLFGGAVGGAITYTLGTTVDYLVDSVSYLFSAVMILLLLKQPLRQVLLVLLFNSSRSQP